ncbi:MAG: HEAT repeat domain-containing protein [Promethearchaeota archaeon]
MSLTLTPENVCHKVVNNQLTKVAATGLLISLLERSNDDETRAKCIDAFSKLGLKMQKIFRIIENCVLSDTSALVRRAAIRVLVQDFPKNDNYLLLKWVVNHENSVIVVKQLFDLFNGIDDPHFNLFKKTLLKKLEDVYNIIADEVELILNLGILYIEYSGEFQLDMHSSWFKIMEFVKKYPDNVGLLPRLMYLRSGGHKLKPLSKTTLSLSELRKIYLKDNEISSLPNFWDRIKVIKGL